MSNFRTCTSCGMPLRLAEDHALGDVAREYCRHCAAPDGSLKSYDEVRAGMAQFLRRTQGVDASVADSMAQQMMANMPAWRSK